MQVVADGADDDLAAVQAHTHLHQQPLGAPHLLGIAPHRLLHGQRRIAGPHGMIFVRQRRPEQGHNPITHDLIHGAFIAMHGRHHALQHRVEEPSGLLRIALGQQFHRALQIRKEHRDLFALAFQRAARGEDFLGEIGGGVGQGCHRGSRRGRGRG